ncbi:MAG TPA: hypothetical protein QF753_07095, partial [Victivallales bacterium]|nr:hypothetical protein [Victivallales bacterium]
SGVYQNIINCIRPHDRLIIPFLGHCAVLRYMKPAATTICIDASAQIIQKWQSMNIPYIQLIHGNGIEYLENIKFNEKERTVIYCDPPYPLNSRKSSKDRYNYELSDENHINLLKIIKSLDCDVLISSYKNSLYEETLKNRNLKTYKSQTRRYTATEYLYMNYTNKEGLLHDYSYIGENYRDRERIAKKIKRWSENIQVLPATERNAILAALKKENGSYRHL